MPLVAHSGLPTFERLKGEGQTVLAPDVAVHQDIRELHVGLLNMMPDAALEATERQFMRLVGECNRIAQFYIHLFTLDELERGPEARKHIDAHYRSFDEVRGEGLDALIITGANVTQPDLSKEPFWRPLIRVIDWAYESVTSTLCSCLATHAVLRFRYAQSRRRLVRKCWGVFPHRVIDRRHPLVIDVNTLFDVPHSRFNEVRREQFEAEGLHVLVEGDAGTHLAVSPDGFRLIFLQGHPEYDATSLLKEFKREVTRFAAGERDTYPPFPENYLGARSRAILDEYRDRVLDAKRATGTMPEFPEALITPELHHTWHDTAVAIFDNWIGSVYQVTNSERGVPFMDGVDPDDPLGLGW